MSGSRNLLASVLVLSAVSGACFEAQPRSDVLLVTVDTLRPDFLGAYGFGPTVSPNLDALARRSVVFERAIAASTRTAPSHATIMTSRWVREHSIGWLNGVTRLEGTPTLAAAFRRAGYDTAAFVGNVTLTTRVGLDDGFAVYDDDLPDAEVNRRRNFERIAEGTTARAVAWLAKARPGPRFLWVHYQDPHGPYTPPPPHDRLRLKGGAARARSLPVLAKNRGPHGIPAYQALGELRRVSEYVERYAGEIRYFDEWLGRLLEAFEAGSRDGIILLTSDHGESLGEDGFYFSHGFRTTPDQAWVPFLLHAPGLPPGRRPEPVHHVDVKPTLLDLAGLPVPADVRGVALAALLRGQKGLPERVLFTDIGSEITAYRGTAFFRARTPVDAGKPGRPGIQRYAWPVARGWRQAGPDAAMDAAIRAYAARQHPMEEADAPDPETVERLRALGYLEQGPDASD